MSSQHAEFSNRLRRLERKHAQPGQAYTAKMRSDGLIVVEPRRIVRSRISGRSFILFVCVILAFKGFLMASLGPANYDYRVDKLRDGSVIEQGGAWIMQSDPVSMMIADRLAPLLR